MLFLELSCMQFDLLFKALLWNIQIKEHYLKWEVIKDLIIILRCGMSI